ncbi:MAG: hypothetical protein JWM41_4505 [Gemmatimonadetes bacterium]|nr:hypothetical protein [Gemmatimonadota bacterium]
MRMRGFIAGLVIAVVARSASAQAAPTGTLIPIANRSYIGFNPLGIPFDIFTVEAESGVAQGITLGGVGSYIDVNNDRYTSFDFKFRYYPGEVVLRGFSLGASVGYLGFSTSDFPRTQTNQAVGRESLSAPTIGVIADYNWLLGSQRRFLVGTGVGAKRVLASAEERQRVNLDRAYLTARFTVGLAF